MSKLPPEDPESIRLMIQSIIDDPNARALLVKTTCPCGKTVYVGGLCKTCGRCEDDCCECVTLAELQSAQGYE